jgi:hypothetical protein
MYINGARLVKPGNRSEGYIPSYAEPEWNGQSLTVPIKACGVYGCTLLPDLTNRATQGKLLLGGNMNCKGCHVEVIDDGHGELVHVTDSNPAGKYGCEPGKKGGEYPVAQ